MKKMHRYLAVVLFSSGALLAGTALAQSPFDGTWRIDHSKTKHEHKPFADYLAQGWYHCESCATPYAIKADGTDQPVSNEAFDTMSVKEVDASTVAIVGKKAGTTIFESTSTVSADGTTLTRKGVNHPPGGQEPVQWTATYKRIGEPPPGVHAISGKWRHVREADSENGLLTTYKTNGDELTMTMKTGMNYTAKFDGKDYPLKGSYRFDTVSLKRIGERTFEETDKMKGQVVEFDTWTVSPDDKTLTLVDVQKPTDRQSTLVFMKVLEEK